MSDEPDDMQDRLRALREAISERVANDPARQARKAAHEAARAQAWAEAKMEAKKPQRVRPKMTAAERRRYEELMLLVPETMLAFRWPELAHSVFPPEWKEIAADEKPGKTRITLRLDADVARFFRKTGRGYQERMNDVLRTFMLARLVEIIGIGHEPPQLMMAQDTQQKMALEKEAALMQEVEEMRRKRLGLG